LTKRDGGLEDLEASVRKILGVEADDALPEEPIQPASRNNLGPAPVSAPSLIPVEASQKVEDVLASIIIEELPTGVSLASVMKQTVITGRSQSYKARTISKYEESVKRVILLYKGISTKQTFSVGPAKDLVGSFVEIMKNDRNILLNLSCMPFSDGDYLYAHAVNGSLMSLALAAAAGYNQEQTIQVALAALLQDVGMIMVPEAIVSKTGPLTPAELFEIHKHPVLGANMLDSLTGMPPVSLMAIYQHHERMSGTGYPKKKSGRFIHPFARIIAIADTYTAMVATRTYRKKNTPYQAMESIVKMGAAGLLDPKLIRKFMEFMSLFPLGSLVRLQSGRIAKVVHANSADFTKPTLMILSDEKGSPLTSTILLDLKVTPTDKIIKALDDSEFKHDMMDGF
jgi:HD-GYP domain-containing protein (c-di-GMP phosphodiesterase class II)